MNFNSPHILALISIILIRLVSQLWFASQTPPFEKFDEYNHFEYARFVAFEHRLPTAADLPPMPAGWEIYNQFNQPPLYYSLLAPLIAVVDDGQPMAVYANPTPTCLRVPDHKFLHPQTNAAWVRGVWAGRFLTMFLGGLTTLLIWGSGRRLFPESPRVGVLAALIYALLPASVEITTWINNDAPLLMWGGLILLGMTDSTPKGRWMLAVGVGGALLTKLNGLAVLPLVGVFIWGKFPRWRGLALSGLVIFLAGFGFYNQQQCGFWACRLHRQTLHFENTDGFIATLRSDYVATAGTQLLRTSAIPWISDQFSPSPFWVGVTLAFLALGLTSSGLESLVNPATRRKTGGLWLLLVSALGLGLLRVWWLQVGYLPIRYLTIALPALVLLVGHGYLILAKIFGRGFPAVFISLLIFLTLSTPLLYYRPFFAVPTPIAVLPPAASPLTDYHFENGLGVVGYQAKEEALTLYLTVLEPQTEPQWLEITLYDEAGNVLEICGQTAGSAFWLPSDWHKGEIIPQTFPLFRLQAAASFRVTAYYLQNEYALVNGADLTRAIHSTEAENHDNIRFP